MNFGLTTTPLNQGWFRAIVYLIGEADFNRFLDTEALPSEGISYIADERNNLIALVSHSTQDFEPIDINEEEGMIEREIDGKRKFIIFTTSKKNNWKYVSILPEEWVVKNVSFYRLISIAVMLIALFICVVTAYYLSKRWSIPIVSGYLDISGFLKKEDIEKLSFSSLSTNINELITYSEDIHDELVSKEVFAHNAFVNRLINGFFKNENDIENYLELLGFSLNENHYSVSIISQGGLNSSDSAQSFDEMIRIKNYIKAKLQQNFSLRIMIAEQDNSNLILILLTDSDNREIHEKKVCEALTTFCTALPHLYTENMRIALGETMDSLMKVHHSYLQAEDVLSLSENSDDKLIIHFRDVDERMDDFYYPLEIESRLISAVKAGNEEVLKSIIEKLEYENMKKRILESSKLKHLIFALKNSCYRISNQLTDKNCEEINKQLDYNDNNADFYALTKFLIGVCRYNNKNKKSHNSTLIEKIIDYLEKNYSDCNLSLQLIAEHFSINESYMSYFFKEQTGTNFSIFLETIRIKKAGELLENTEKPIFCIAKDVGYNSDKTFRRVFQKHFNMTPGQYRGD